MTRSKAQQVNKNHQPSIDIKHQLQEVREALGAANLRIVDFESKERERLDAELALSRSLEQTSAEATLVTNPTEKLSLEWLYDIEGQCRRAKITIPDSWPTVSIFAKGDEQLGHRRCDVERIIKDIEWIKNNPHTLCVLLGDTVDSATKESPGSQYENDSPPFAQLRRFVELHQPIKNRIIGAVTGNHEARMDRTIGAGEVARYLADGLSPAEYRVPVSSGLLLLDLHWKGFRWTVTLFHGAGAAQTPGAKIQRMQRNMALTDSMITLSGHLHDEAKTSKRFVRRLNDGSLTMSKQTTLQCGTYLKYLGTYAEGAGMAPGGVDMILIVLHPDGKYTDQFKGEGNN